MPVWHDSIKRMSGPAVANTLVKLRNVQSSIKKQLRTLLISSGLSKSLLWVILTLKPKNTGESIKKIDS